MASIYNGVCYGRLYFQIEKKHPEAENTFKLRKKVY